MTLDDAFDLALSKGYFFVEIGYCGVYTFGDFI